MDFNLIKVKGVIYPVKFEVGIGYFVDVNCQATTKPTKKELYEKLVELYGNEVEIMKPEAQK